MKKLFKVSVSKVYVVYLLLLTIFVVGTYSSYAYFTVNKEKKNAINMVTGNLIGELKVDGEINDKLVVNGNQTKIFEIEVINKNERKARFNFYYKGSLKEGVEVGYVEGDGYNAMIKETGVTLEESGTLGYYLKYRIKVVNNTSNNIEIPLGYSAGLDYNDLSLPNDGHLFTKMEVPKAIDTLLTDYTNSENIQDYDVNHDKTNSNVKENKMYVFNHEAGEQQNEWSTDELKDYRYIGADPNNYVTFNDEEAGWRIIGIFTVEDENGKKEKRIKLIRKQEIGKFSWDNRNTETGAEDNKGSNDWKSSRIMKLLNPGYNQETAGSLYWDRKKGACYSGQNNASVSCSFEEIGLTPMAQEMIGQTRWYLGALPNFPNAKEMYSYERSTNIYQSTINPRKESAISYIALLYPSDYRYATSGGTTISRSNCLDMDSGEWGQQSECYNNNYLYFSNQHAWLLNPCSFIAPGYSLSAYVTDRNNNGYVGGANAWENRLIFPTLYLKEDVRYISGNGTTSNPFVFEK